MTTPSELTPYERIRARDDARTLGDKMSGPGLDPGDGRRVVELLEVLHDLLSQKAKPAELVACPECVYQGGFE